MKTLRGLVLILALSLVVIGPASAQVTSYETAKHDIVVYRDGVVLVLQQFKINQSVAQINVPLLSSSASSIFVTDQLKAPMSFEHIGRNITVYTLGASTAYVEYQVSDITSKEGAVWTLEMNLLAKANLTLPDQATITFLNAIPEIISFESGKPVLLLDQGSWEISYTLPVIVEAQPDPQPQQPAPAQNPPQQLPAISNPQTTSIVTLLIPVAGVAIAVLGVFLFYRMRRSPEIDTDVKLRPEEESLLNFLAENGRKALESDLRKKFIIPKTSMWRMSKRLERLGYVKINRYGSQNEIELLKKP
ncbi:MAG: hypothetical protein FJ358_00455 [Thaumarchaeota archaeon]|nr:hypothetical protein [Nitrososphaerota archaeon]